MSLRSGTAGVKSSSREKGAPVVGMATEASAAVATASSMSAVAFALDSAIMPGMASEAAGMDASAALLQEDILPHLLLQVVVKEENKDAQWAKDIVAAYHSDAFKEYLDKNNNGLWYVPNELFVTIQ